MQCSDWLANWIEPMQTPTYLEEQISPIEAAIFKQTSPEQLSLYPCQMLRREFFIKSDVYKARICVTAHGIYKMEIDGVRVGNIEFAPETTNYNEFLQYQTYDITKSMSMGKHVIGIVLADGWYAGRLGSMGDSCQYGNMIGLLMQIEIEYMNGDHEGIFSDETFKSSTGPWIYSDLYMGEKYDSRLEKNGWSCVEFNDEKWSNVKKLN